jgi:hypothetical protein
LSEYFIVSFSSEGRLIEKKHVEDEAQTEEIAYRFVLGLHVFDVDNLGSHVARSSASHEEVLISIAELSQPEISDHQVTAARCAENEIFRFEIPMHGFFGVHLFEPAENGLHDFLDFVGFEFFLSLDLIM